MTGIIADLQVNGASLQFVRVPVADAAGTDPTADPVSFAFPAPGAEPVTFYAGSWSTLSGIYYARCLVGSNGAVSLPVGFYDVYVKITDSPEVPVLLSGVLEVT